MADHRAHAETLRARVEGTEGVTDPALRRSILEQLAGGPTTDEPYATLAKQVSEAAYRVTDAQVADVRRVTGTDKAAFEIVMTAAIGAGLLRFDRAMLILKGATDAPR